MTKPQTRSVNLPFPGFYDSWYSHAIDREEEQWCEYEAGEREDGEQQYPAELRLTDGELAELLFRHTTYSTAYHAVAREYVGAFDWKAGEALDLALGLAFEEMTSPREYNFQTDRIFATVPLKTVRALFAVSKADGHKSLSAVLEDRHTSRSGFHSWYSNDLDTWLSKPVGDWDHNELGSLLLACLAIAGVDWEEFEGELYEGTDTGNGEFSNAWDSAVDWPAFEAARDDLRADKAEAAGLPVLDWRTGPAIRHPAQVELGL